MDDVESSGGSNCIPLSLQYKGVVSLHLACDGTEGVISLGGVSDGTKIDVVSNKGRDSG
jgi:hypothetical protein